MTTASAHSTTPVPATRRQYVITAVLASVVHMLMMIPGYTEDDEFQTGEFATILAISLAVSILLFLFAVPGGGAITALVLAVVALASVLVFWAGLTLPLAAAGAVTAWRSRQAGDRPGMATAALALSALAAVALVAIIISDAAAN
jgi:hypothetical protein